MKYKFPEIQTIDDVLPHIDGRDEFIVAEREFGTVVNYNVVMPDTFPPIKVAGGSAKMREQRALTNAMRRECRGLIFDKEGKIMSRPFHKFFNIGERNETQPNLIDLSQDHNRLEKMDGSMIRPILVDNGIRLATKMGLTDIAQDAEDWVFYQDNSLEKFIFLRTKVESNITPIFEWVSPNNKIVVDYDEPDLVLLALRDNITGDYYPVSEDSPFTVVKHHGSIQEDIRTYIENARQLDNREGDIIRFTDGHMLKIKNDWYVRIHKIMDSIRFEKNIIDLILNEELDDVLSMLPDDDRYDILDLEKKFWIAVEEKTSDLESLYNQAMGYETKKNIALKFIPILTDKIAGGMLFKMIDGKGSARELVMNKIKTSLGTNTKWEGTKEWLNMQ